MTSENWSTAFEFLIFAIIIAGAILLVIKLFKAPGYRIAALVALIGTFLIAWVNLAVGIIGEPENPANLMYVAVPMIGAVGTLVARFRPKGMARTLLLMAIAQGIVAVITLAGGLGLPVTPPFTLLIFNGVLIALWLGSAALFRRATQRANPIGADKTSPG